MLSICLLREKFPIPVSVSFVTEKADWGMRRKELNQIAEEEDCYCVLGSLALALEQQGKMTKECSLYSRFPGFSAGAALLEMANGKLFEYSGEQISPNRLSVRLARTIARYNDAGKFEEAYRLLHLALNFDPWNKEIIKEIYDTLQSGDNPSKYS